MNNKPRSCCTLCFGLLLSYKELWEIEVVFEMNMKVDVL